MINIEKILSYFHNIKIAMIEIQASRIKFENNLDLCEGILENLGQQRYYPDEHMNTPNIKITSWLGTYDIVFHNVNGYGYILPEDVHSIEGLYLFLLQCDIDYLTHLYGMSQMHLNPDMIKEFRYIMEYYNGDDTYMRSKILYESFITG